MLTTDLVRSNASACSDPRLSKDLFPHLSHAFFRLQVILRAVLRDAIPVHQLSPFRTNFDDDILEVSLITSSNNHRRVVPLEDTHDFP